MISVGQKVWGLIYTWLQWLQTTALSVELGGFTFKSCNHLVTRLVDNNQKHERFCNHPVTTSSLHNTTGRSVTTVTGSVTTLVDNNLSVVERGCNHCNHCNQVFIYPPNFWWQNRRA